MYISNSNNIGMATLLQNNKNCMKTLTNGGSVVGVGAAGNIIVGNVVSGGSAPTVSGSNNQLGLVASSSVVGATHMSNSGVGTTTALGGGLTAANGGLAVITDNSNHHNNVVASTAATGGTTTQGAFLLATSTHANTGTAASNFQHQLQHQLTGGNGQVVTTTPATSDLLQHQQHQQQNQSRLVTTTAPGGALNARQISQPAVASNNRTTAVLINRNNMINSKTNAITNNTKSFTNTSTTISAASPATSSYYITNATTNTVNGHHMISSSNTSSFTSSSTTTINTGSSSNALSKTTSMTIKTDLPASTKTNGHVLNSSSDTTVNATATTNNNNNNNNNRNRNNTKTNDGNQSATVDRATSSINSANASSLSVSSSSENTGSSSADPAKSHSELNPNVAVKPEESQEAEPEIDIVINNVVCSFSVRCHLNLREIALHGSNVEYRRENGMVTMKLRRPYTTASIWSSGRITCTGATSEDQAKIAARRYARCLEKLGFRVRFHNFRVVNVLGTCSMPWAIKIVNFSEKFKREASYEPELHPGVTYKLRYPKATLKIFSTGSITVTAASVANVQAAIEHIYPLVYEFRKKRSPEELEQMRLKQQLAAGLHDIIELDETVKLNRRKSSLVTSATSQYPNAKRRCTKPLVGEREFEEYDPDDPDEDGSSSLVVDDDMVMYDPNDLIEGPDDVDEQDVDL
uniref:TATA box-binding protein-like 1 n=1 Tax=Glossina palpalis gambiensis TaxID=67801 RepID=A0A1B0BQT1_9MUSC